VLLIPVEHVRGRGEHPRLGVHRGIPGMKRHINVYDKVDGIRLTMGDPYYLCGDCDVTCTRTGKERGK
jgi:hypothetical protein